MRRDQTVICTQFPLPIAAACTVHKSQSSTCPELVVEITPKMFLGTLDICRIK